MQKYPARGTRQQVESVRELQGTAAGLFPLAGRERENWSLALKRDALRGSRGQTGTG